MTKVALLLMDVQVGIVEAVAGLLSPTSANPSADLFLEPFVASVLAARSAQMPIIFVRLALRPNAPEVSGRNLAFSQIAASQHMSDGGFATEIHPSLSPYPEDIVVVKKRVSAFSGSDLAVVLRSLEVTTLVLGGITTSGVVLSTVREASDLDYEITVLRDACIDTDAEVHRVLLERVFPTQATVLGTDDWAQTLR